MRYLDYICAWAVLLTSVSFMLAIEIRHLRGAILDIPFLWLLVAMLNLLRLRNEDSCVPGLMITCVGANLVALTLEIVRWKLFGGGILKAWGPYTFIAAVLFLGETILSMVRRNDPATPARL